MNLCFGCMTDKSGGIEKCHNCGYINGQKKDEHYYLEEGTRLNDRYIVGRVLGHGGFGITYIGLDTKLDTKVAIKEYLPSEISTRALGESTITTFSGEKYDAFVYGLGRFIDEAKTLAQYNDHPSIVSITDYFQENNTAYIVMEYLDGISLSQYIKRNNGKIPYSETIKIISPVLDALQEVHSHNMIHRDVSPDNIFITRDGRIKLLDFGAARHAMGEKSKSLSVILKPGYAPPEQYYTKGKQGVWTDIYAVAATIYKCLTGKIPPEAMERMSDDSNEFLIALDNLENKNIKGVLEKALSLKVEERYSDISEFIDYLINNKRVDDARVTSKQSTIQSDILTQMKRQSYSQLPSKQPVYNPRTEERFETGNQKNSKKKLLIAAGIAAVILLIIVFTNVDINTNSYDDYYYDEVGGEYVSSSYLEENNIAASEEYEVTQNQSYEEAEEEFSYPNGCVEYAGAIYTSDAQIPIHMWLTVTNSSDVDGKYYYDKHKKDIKLIGYVDNRMYYMEEYSDGKHTGIFELYYMDGYFEGSWESPDGSEYYSVYIEER